MTKRQQGFTIIEVVLVLAIAALIFLIVFLAIPQMQKSRRDAKRKSDTGLLISAFQTYAGNNLGNYPDPSNTAQMSDFTTNYMDSKLKDPATGSAYAFVTSAPTGNGQIQYARAASCSGETLNTGTGNNREIALLTKLEAGSSYCKGN